MSERRAVYAVDEARQVLDQHCSERDFQAQVERLARLYGWLVYHTRDSRGSAAGFPDLTLLRPGTDDCAGRLVFLELKSERGQVTDDQAEWLAGLATVPGISVFLSRPSDWDEIEQTLRGDRVAAWRTREREG